MGKEKQTRESHNTPLTRGVRHGVGHQKFLLTSLCPALSGSQPDRALVYERKWRLPLDHAARRWQIEAATAGRL